jgi:hypothetical protein
MDGGRIPTHSTCAVGGRLISVEADFGLPCSSESPKTVTRSCASANTETTTDTRDETKNPTVAIKTIVIEAKVKYNTSSVMLEHTFRVT